VHADDRTVPDRVVVGDKTRMALRVIADVNEQLGGLGRDEDVLEESAGTGPLLVRDDGALAPVGESHGIRAALGDPCEQCPTCHRPVDGAVWCKAVTGDTTHSASDLSVAVLSRRIGGRPC
jgi:hypothetical protein